MTMTSTDALAAGIDEQAVADYAEAWPAFCAAQDEGRLADAMRRMRMAADPVTGLVMLPARAVGFDDVLAGGWRIAASSGGEGRRLWILFGPGRELPRHLSPADDELIAVKPGRSWWSGAPR